MHALRLRITVFVAVAALWGGLFMGCSGRPSLFPNSDKSLRKTSTQFAADAAKRHPLNENLPPGGDAVGRAQVGYSLDIVQIWNASDEDWTNVEIWANRKFVCGVPLIEAKGERVKTLNFQMFFDDNGNSFPTDNREAKNQIQTLEMVKDGKIYSLKLKLAD